MKSCLICDDHVMVREALSGTVRLGWPRVKIATASNFVSAWEACQGNHDLCLLDLVMPGASPYEGVRLLMERSPDLPVIVITGTEDDALMLALLELGIRGFVQKTANTSIIDAAIRLVLAGGRYLPERLVNIAAERAESRGTGLPRISSAPLNQIRLTARQQLVLKLVASGKTNKEIGRDLGIAPSTVKTHLDQILKFLNAANRTEAVCSAYELGILAP